MCLSCWRVGMLSCQLRQVVYIHAADEVSECGHIVVVMYVSVYACDYAIVYANM